MAKWAWCAVFLLVLSGCATHLKTYDSDGKTETVGIPIPIPMLVKVTSTTSYELAPGSPDSESHYCNKTKIKESYDYISSGSYYYLNIAPSEFAKGSMELGFNDRGLANKIAINSDANTGVDSVAGVLETLIPYFKSPKVSDVSADPAIAKASTSVSEPAEVLRARYCLEKAVAIKLERLIVGN
ncbi:hypothetical protein R50072_11790 [Simiduia litorea]|uniref:hypothetical protein n=1 Tax=Simiduia litorea TaxID=1435348 RepID=UPI0036F2CDDA